MTITQYTSKSSILAYYKRDSKGVQFFMNIYFNVAYQGCALPAEVKLYLETLPYIFHLLSKI